MKKTMIKNCDILNEGCEDQTHIYGFKKKKWREITCMVFYFFTLGALKLVFDWYPALMIRLKCTRCPLSEADFVELVDQYNQNLVSQVLHQGASDTLKYFVCKKVKYYWNDREKNFNKLRGPHHGRSCSYFHECHGLTAAEQEDRLSIFGPNSIRIHVTPILKLLYTQGLNPFYMFQMFSCTLWFLDQYYYFAGCIIILSAFSLAAQIYQMRLAERKLKHTVGRSEKVHVLRGGTGEFEWMEAEELVPGDVIEVPRNGCLMQCDAVLTSGICIVNESMLTGESVPITKTSVPYPRSYSSSEEAFNEKDHSRHVLYCGTKVIQTRFYDNQKVTAVVMHTGFMTSKGELVRSILFPKPVNFKFTQDSYKFLACLAAVAAIGMVYTIVLMLSRKEATKRIVVRTLDLVTIVIPPALPAAMTVGVVMAQKRLWDSLIYCINSKNINLCGAVNCFCFDKTGTLTEDGLDLKVVVPVFDRGFREEVGDLKHLGQRSTIVVAMATCHSLTTIDDKVVGDPMDLKMFEATDWVFDEGGGKFDAFVPTVVKPRERQGAALDDPNSEDYGILRQFTFSSKLQRMSVVVRGLQAPHYELFCKGAPEMIASLSLPETVPSNFQKVLMSYTRQGYRVLAVAHRKLRMSLIKVQRCQREQVEKKLTFLGLVVFENQLKMQTRSTVHALNQARIRLIMVTGDNMLTALSVAKNCDMIGQRDKIVFITSLPSGQSNGTGFEIHWAKVAEESDADDDNDRARSLDRDRVSFKNDLVGMPRMSDSGRTHLAVTGQSWSLLRRHHPSILPQLLEQGTVFSRFSPDQKQQLVESLIETGNYVGMCGDGANDCGALSAAHAGISLSEAEASVASPFTSKQANISCVPDLIREGRAALVTSFGIFKFMASYSLTQFTSVCILYWVGANLTDMTFLYIDMILLSSLSFTYSRTKAYPFLDPDIPRITLLALPPILSILLQVLTNMLFQLITWYFTNQQPWFEAYSAPPSYIRNFGCHEVTAVFCVSAFQYITLAIVFSKGAPYRQSVLTNYLFILNVILVTAITCLIVVSPLPVDWFYSLFQLKPAPDLAFRFLLVMVALLNFIISFALEMIIIDILLDRKFKKLHPRRTESIGTKETSALESEGTLLQGYKNLSTGRGFTAIDIKPSASINCEEPGGTFVRDGLNFYGHRDLRGTKTKPSTDWLPAKNEHRSLAELMEVERATWEAIEASMPRPRASEASFFDFSDDDEEERSSSRKCSISSTLVRRLSGVGHREGSDEVSLIESNL